MEVIEGSDVQVNSLLEVVLKIVLDQDNRELMKLFMMEEIWKIIQYFPPDKAPSPDGFIALFYQKCWDVLGWELVLTLEESRSKGVMLKNFNSTNIAIIPKKWRPSNIF